ncbi:MAG: TonB-dependent receptor plug domain-containing protein [Bacteroidales bacterium]|jgi:TonB-dependent SusC/RagA subfamily outer membrane receptor|nr:TonB-dependent receptor plug domain-containing protein [Bacteroidales bacterium]
MENFIIHTLKSGLCLGVFLTIYALLLRNTTFFKFNRAFLITGIVASLIVPSIRYTYNVFIPVTNTTGIVPETSTPDTSISIWIIAFAMYITGIITLIVINMFSYMKLKKLISNGEKSDAGSCKIIESIDITSPFSVLNYVIINTKNLSNVEKDLIMKHEITHIDQKHWIDLFCSECILLLQWFNPLAWIYVRLLKENHEFLADKAVIDSGISPIVYQAVLINQRFQKQVFSLSNSFSYTKPQIRLEMIKKTQSSPWKRIGALTIVPVFGMFIWTSATPNYIFTQEPLVVTETETVKDTITGATLSGDINVIGYGTQSKNSTGTNGIANKNKPLFILDGQKIGNQEMDKIDPNTIESITVLKDGEAVAKYGEDAKNGVIIIRTKEYVKNTQPETASTKKEIRFAGNEVNVTSDNLEEILLIVNGKEVSPDTYKALNPAEIESIEVIKDVEAVSTYGDKGKNGVIIVEMK